jgi:hypothetical protein
MGEQPSDDNSNLVDMDDLESFENAFYDRKPEPSEEAAEVEEVVDDEEVAENEDDALATDEDTDASAETEDEGEDEDEEPEDKPEPKSKKNRKSFQERIDELTAKAREAERREADAIRRLEALEARKPEVKQDEPTPLRDRLPDNAPNPDAVDDKGESVYPLGEFDPHYIRDLTKFTIAEENRVIKEKEVEERQVAERAAAQQHLLTSWQEKVEKAEEEIPDIRENIRELAVAFDGVDPAYGDYLAATVMSCENGPEIMNYLSQNIGEAQKIVSSGAVAATLAIGRLEAKLQKAPQEEKRNKRVSDAPKPPEERARGRGGQFTVSPDTDDLDAFERVFFKKR